MRIKAGAIVLSVWSALNLAVALIVTGATVADGHALLLRLLFDEAQRRALDPKLVAIIDAQALLANPCIAALCTMMLVVIWTSLIREARWAFLLLASTLLPLQVFGYVSDATIGNRNLGVNLVSTALLLAGLALARPRQNLTPGLTARSGHRTQPG
jgi:hypothetical protein